MTKSRSNLLANPDNLLIVRYGNGEHDVVIRKKKVVDGSRAMKWAIGLTEWELRKMVEVIEP